MESADVVVVGAGPSGSTAAHELVRRGHSVLVVEEHARVGHPVQCAGLVSQRVLDLAGSDSMVRLPVHGATVLSPNLNALSFHAESPRAFVIDRAGLDIHLADRAARAGARFATGTKFAGVTSHGAEGLVLDLVDEQGRAHQVRTRLVIGADGVASAVARAFRIRRPLEILPAFEAEFPESAGESDLVDVYLGNRISPGLFGWSIPDGAGGARVGVAVTPSATSARTYCERLVAQVERRSGHRLRNPTSYLVSGIPIGSMPRTSGDAVLLVGDAAGQVKPLSGGGIFTGMRCAQIAAEVADPALRARDLSAGRLAAYDRAWREELGDEFQRALRLRRIFLRLTDADLERVVAALQSAGMRESIIAFGDIDFPTHVAGQLLRQSPSLLRLVPKALGAIAGSGGQRAPDLDPGPRRAA